MKMLAADWREKKALAWASGGLWVFVSAFLWAPSRDGLEAVYALAFFIPMLFAISFRNTVLYFRCGWYLALALIYAGYAASTTLWSKQPDVGYFSLQIVILFSWLYGAIWIFSKEKFNLDLFFDFMIFVGTLVGVSLLIVFYINNEFSARLAGWSVLRNPNSVGAAFGVLTLLAYFKWLMAKNVVVGSRYFIAMLILFVPLLASQSRGALLALILVGVLSLIHIKPSRPKVVLHMIGLIVVMLGVFIKLDDLSAIFLSRLDDGERLFIWSEIFSRSIHEHLFFGIGMEKEGRIIIPDLDVFNHAHNSWLDIFYRTGACGLLLALIHLFYVMSKFSVSKEEYPLYLWLIYGCLTSMVDSRGFFWQIDSRWFVYWIPVGLITAHHVISHPLFKAQTEIKTLEAVR